MHLLRSTAIGTEVIDNIDHHIHGKVSDVLIEPDRGKIIALFVEVPGMPELMALQTQDIASWGNRVHIRGPEVMGELDGFVRLASLLGDPRGVIGQSIRTKSGSFFGTCVDIQFRTDTFDIEWIFPRKFFILKGPALPVSDILEITSKAILIKDQGLAEEKREEGEAEPERLETVVTPAAGRSASRYSRK
jgi:sporulation protein YlmC with PRC-barrel domain